MSILSVATSTTAVLGGGFHEKVYLDNRGSNTIWVIIGEPAVLNEGIPLDSSASIILENVTGEINGIAETGATNLSVYEN